MSVAAGVFVSIMLDGVYEMCGVILDGPIHHFMHATHTAIISIHW